MEEDIKILEDMIKRLDKNCFDIYRKAKNTEDYLGTITGKEIISVENLLTRYKRLEEENKDLEEEKEQYKNDYFNLYEQNKQYIHYSKIEELAKKIHNELDKNGITRAYQTIIDSYFDEVLGG